MINSFDIKKIIGYSKLNTDIDSSELDSLFSVSVKFCLLTCINKFLFLFFKRL